MIFTTPERSPYTVPPPTAPYWTLPTVTSSPCSRACSSVRPNEPTLGVQKVARGMSMYSIGCVSRPAASSTAMMPSSDALWASAGPWTRSPIAYTPLADVLSAPSTSISPLSSSFTPASSSPRPSMSGPRPAAMMNHSTSAVWSPYVNVTLSSPPCTFSTSVPVLTEMFCLASERPTTLEMSASSVGSTRSSASNSSTSVPMRPYADAISAPDAPAPTTAILPGSDSNAHASSVPITRPPNCVAGIGFGTEPVASTTQVLASITLPSKFPPTLTLPPSVTEPKPSIRSILFFLNSPPTPPTRVEMTLPRRS